MVSKSSDKIHPVILCGGSGTRLWPLSRKDRPKPFLPLIGKKTLFERAVERASDHERFAPVTVVAGEQHVSLIENQLGDAPEAQLIVEPEGRNTAPAIGLAAAMLDPDAIMLVCPSDHHIANDDAFRKAAFAAADLARDDHLVSFGIEATSPETGYGYLERGEPLPGGFKLARFVEKPTLAVAEQYLASGKYSWNGGIFVFRAGCLLEELSKCRPEMAKALSEAVAKGQKTGSRFYPDPGAFGSIEGESVDYAVMENTSAAAMVPADMGWSDIGNWAALADALGDHADEAGNIARAGAADFDACRNVFTSSDGPRVSVIGLEDVCVVVSGNEVLVTSRDGAQRVGKLPGAANQ